MPTYREEGIVIRKKDFGEADKILTIYTRDRGRVVAFAPGARRITSRKASATELFTHGIYFLSQGKEMDTITESEVLNSFYPLRDDLTKAALAFYLAELLGYLVVDSQPNYPVYRLFLESISLLSRAKRRHELWIRAFEIKALTQLGFGPELFQCSHCTEPLSAEKYFQAGLGGMVCRECFEDGILLTDEQLLFVRDLARLNWNELSRLRFEDHHLTDAEKILGYYLREVLEKEIAAADFVKQAKQELVVSSQQ
ncbi:DNA repair protein RecO [candidate division WWE3 bacterium RBG_19FT_COMBO_53_11]|uniref:DNA repair protein RecO n=1 Tax=candidate division WWE3 bacterium RBG_19FT_COMBO_53_11 TaxID=1802613 RepID=A0A1F4UI57_UNCKA|nr:MAG: DNA repair protein RecO [candidate division WWE3 bacterium RBG_19FT_COMBO_53_11]